MKVLLTGAAGFIGSCYLRKLNDMGVDDVTLADASADGGRHPNLSAKKFNDYLVREELLKRADANRLPEFDAIVHLGACSDTTEPDRSYLIRNNLEYSQTLARWALAKNRIFQYASSASVYGDGSKGFSDADAALTDFKPLNYYAESKWLFDRWVVAEKLQSRFVGYRYFNVYGPNEYHKGDMQSMVSKAYKQILKEGRVSLFGTVRPDFPDGAECRDFVYVKDVNAVMGFFLEHPDRGGIYNVGTGEPRTFKDLVSAVFTALGKTPKIDFIPMPEKLRGKYQFYTKADISRLRAAGYTRPFERMEDSVRDYVLSHLTKENPVF